MILPTFNEKKRIIKKGKNMKKLIITSIAILATASVFAQTDTNKLGIRSVNWSPKSKKFHEQSLAVSQTSNSISALWLRDGLSNDYTALSYPLAQVTGLGARVNIVALGAYQINSPKTNFYTGTGVSVNLFQSQGWKADLYGGLKGFNLTQNATFSSGRNAWVFGVGVTIPIH